MFKQCHLSGRSWQLQEHCLHLDVAIQLPWLRNGYLSMVEEVMQHCLSLSDNWVSLLNSYKLHLTDWKMVLTLIGGGGPIMGDLWALKGLIEEG